MPCCASPPLAVLWFQGSNPHKRWLAAGRYIQRPLLVGGRKFHLRAYLLCVGALDVYVFKARPTHNEQSCKAKGRPIHLCA